MVKKVVVVLLITVMCFIVPICVRFFTSGNKVLINVRSGDSASVTAARLKKNKLIYSEKLFFCLVKLTKAQNKLKAGVYSFSKKDGMFKILRSLKNGSENLLRFTVPEGKNINQTAEIISRTINIDKEKFVKIAANRNMEGYLMPETYFVDPRISERRLVEMMYSEFNKKITPDMYKRAKEINVSFKDVVIIASIVEKEAVKQEERAIIAAVFYNRLKDNTKLQSCATVLYAMGINKAKLSSEDTKFDSPYNTYKHLGLPPGPICSPGIESIKAALYPADTKNMFFVSAGNGSHLFASDSYGHKKNRQIISKKRNQRKA
ncbi:MAG: endolytic transglycosylase MltG [Endomicrobium sp.]|nr:endolytic transglycosylase MltG [Endomicrobium sp.]